MSEGESLSRDAGRKYMPNPIQMHLGQIFPWILVWDYLKRKVTCNTCCGDRFTKQFILFLL